MGVIGFLMGLGMGIVILVWQRSRSNQKIKRLLSGLQPEVANTPFSVTSQLSLAIAYQQQIQQSLEHQLEIYRRLLRVAPIGFLLVDEENQLLWCNAEARTLLKMPADCDREPRLLLELVRSYELDDLIESIRTSQKPGQRDWTFYPYNPDPTRLSKQQSYALRAYGFPLEDNTTGIFIESRQEAMTLMQQRDRWASDVAHELKTPLTSIRLIAETLQSRLDAPLQGWADRLVNQTIRLSNLVQDLLELGKLEQNAFENLSLSTVDFVDLIHSSWNSLEPLFRKKNLKLGYEGPESLILQLDDVRFYRVLINLFDNSIKFSPPWGIIQVTVALEMPSDTEQAFSDTSMVCLNVIDMGPGFAEHDLPYVFERFYRADTSRARNTKTILDGDGHYLQNNSPKTSSDNDHDHGDAMSSNPSPASSIPSPQVHPIEAHPAQVSPASVAAKGQQNSQGSGLGLAIVQQIVEAHRGTVTANNHPETGGAWIQIRLPRYTDIVSQRSNQFPIQV